MKYAILAALALTALAATPAAARPARCVVTSAGSPTYRGPCDFISERGGSFSISTARGSFGDSISVISLGIVSPGVGDVRGLTSDGINSRRDPACWVGEDFSLCVY